jgi:hypothetical protein
VKDRIEGRLGEIEAFARRQWKKSPGRAVAGVLAGIIGILILLGAVFGG